MRSESALLIHILEIGYATQAMVVSNGTVHFLADPRGRIIRRRNDL